MADENSHCESGGSFADAWHDAPLDTYIDPEIRTVVTPYKESSELLRIGRNDPCFCGSGRKYKKCCIDAPFTTRRSRYLRLLALVMFGLIGFALYAGLFRD